MCLKGHRPGAYGVPPTSLGRAGIAAKFAALLIVFVVIAAVGAVALLDSGFVTNRMTPSTSSSSSVIVSSVTPTMATVSASSSSSTSASLVGQQTTTSNDNDSSSPTSSSITVTSGIAVGTSSSTTMVSVSVDTATSGAGNLSGFQVESLQIVAADNSTVTTGFVYVASDALQQAQGFMNETGFGTCNGLAAGPGGSSDNNSGQCIGMIFVFSEQQDLCFWMHDTPLPLQQDWIGANGTVIYTYQAQPENDGSVCHDAEFVLETYPSDPVVVGDQVLQGNP